MKELSFIHKLTKNGPLILKMPKSASDSLFLFFYPASRFSDIQNNCPELAGVPRLKKVKPKHYKCNDVVCSVTWQRSRAEQTWSAVRLFAIISRMTSVYLHQWHYISIKCPWSHCNDKPIYVFPEKELHGLSPNFHIHVAVSNLYIPRIGPPIFLQQNRQTDCGNI